MARARAPHPNATDADAAVLSPGAARGEGVREQPSSGTVPRGRREALDGEARDDERRELGRPAAAGHGSLSLNGDWLGADAALSEILGRSAGEICATTLRALTHPDDVAHDVAGMDAIRRHAMEAYQTEKRFLHKDGRCVWVSQIVWAICDDRGTRLHLSCQVTPIAEPTRQPSASAEARARAEEQRRIAATLDSIGEAVIATDRTGAVRHMNPVAERLTGFSLDEALGKPLPVIVRLFDPATRAPSSDVTLADSTRDRQIVHPNLGLAARDGSERVVSATCAPIRDGAAGENEGGAVLVLRDTTDEQRAILALRRSEASFRALIEHSPELIVVLRNDRIVYVNAAVLRSLGYTEREELIGKGLLADIVHPDDRELVADRVTDGDHARSSLPPLGARWRCKDGGYRTTETMGMPIEFDGAPAVVVLARDVTERNEIQAQLLRNDRMAALGTLAAGVAHEINNPLTYLLVNVEHVLRRLRALAASNNPLEELENEERGDVLNGYVQSLQQAVEGANRVRQIVRDLMTFSQGNVEQRGLVDLRGVVESAIQMAWHEIRHRARLVKNLHEIPPVEASEARLGQVFLNLLVNAAQAIPEGDANNHQVRVSTRVDDGGRVIVEVTDTGTGIAPEALPRIFDPFFTTKRTGAGMGLGLSISHGTVKSLGGELTVESTPGKGTTFRVSLPAAKSYRARSPQSSPQIRAVERKKILVIDDEPLVSHAIARVLSDDNDVRSVTQATEALQLIQNHEQFDLILCDLMMPVMTGMDLYAEVVRLAPQLAGRIVFMTGGAFTPRARAFLESVSNPCLEKPIEMSKLRSLIARAGERAAVRPA